MWDEEQCNLCPGVLERLELYLICWFGFRKGKKKKASKGGKFHLISNFDSAEQL